MFAKILPLWWTTEYYYHLPPPISLYSPLVSPFSHMFPHFPPFFLWQREVEWVTGVPPWAGSQGPWVAGAGHGPNGGSLSNVVLKACGAHTHVPGQPQVMMDSAMGTYSLSVASLYRGEWEEKWLILNDCQRGEICVLLNAEDFGKLRSEDPGQGDSALEVPQKPPNDFTPAAEESALPDGPMGVNPAAVAGAAGVPAAVPGAAGVPAAMPGGTTNIGNINISNNINVINNVIQAPEKPSVPQQVNPSRIRS